MGPRWSATSTPIGRRWPSATPPAPSAGLALALSVFDLVHGGGYEILDQQLDGDQLVAGRPALMLRGRSRGLFTAERTALNPLTHASGVATLTAQWVNAVSGTSCTIRDTRKTIPGMRAIQKYAVRCGGGTNHRLGLGDAIVIKDNHIAAARSVCAAGAAAPRHAPDLPCEVEVDDLDQLDEALCLDIDEILLDNFTRPRAPKPSAAATTGACPSPSKHPAASTSPTPQPTRPPESTT